MLILSQGLLMNLVVIPHVTKKGKVTDKFEVVAGGRRRRALARLAELGKIAPDETVLCKLTTRGKALAASVAENSASRCPSRTPSKRLPRWFASGATPEDISVSFGITPLTVQRRLKLANVSPKLFELYRAEEISTEQMMALAIVDDHEAQERVWEGTSSYDRHPATLRRLLLGREIEAARDPEAVYVGDCDDAPTRRPHSAADRPSRRRCDVRLFPLNRIPSATASGPNDAVVVGLAGPRRTWRSSSSTRRFNLAISER